MNRQFYVVGPTACGKSELAAAIAEHLDGEVVNVDAFQIYKELPVLTAQPSREILQRTSHHLVGCLSVTEEMSAERFRALAANVIQQIETRSKPAILAGGSGLYVKALTDGLIPLPPIDRELRAKLNQLSLEDLNERLSRIDPSRAQGVDRQNKRRVARALEIALQTGRQEPEEVGSWSTKSRSLGVFVFRERGELYARINQRVIQMFRDGVVDEVRAIKNKVGETAKKTIGLIPILQLLEGKVTRDECIATIQQSTRRYAKRQLTWFSRQTTFEPLNLSHLKDHSVVIETILQKARSAFAFAE